MYAYPITCLSLSQDFALLSEKYNSAANFLRYLALNHIKLLIFVLHVVIISIIFKIYTMAKEDLTGNVATETLEEFAQKNNLELGLNISELHISYQSSWKIFGVYH